MIQNSPPKSKTSKTGWISGKRGGGGNPKITRKPKKIENKAGIPAGPESEKI